MRYFLTIAIIGLILSACGSKRSVTSSQIAPASELTITDETLIQGISDTLQLGRMRQGEIIAKTVRLHNECSRPIVILREATSCGCTTASYTRQPLAPGSSFDIVVEFNSQGQMGWQMKRIEFYLAEKGTPLRIYIDAEVE